MKEHDSYGVISISKIQTDLRNELFGTESKYPSHIYEITIQKGKKNIDKRYGGITYEHQSRVPSIIKFNMSERQILELLLSGNTNKEIPITIISLNGSHIEGNVLPEDYTFLTNFKEVYTEQLSGTQEKLKATINKITNSDKVTKGFLNEIKDDLNSINISLSRNIPYIEEMLLDTVEIYEDYAKSDSSPDELD